jgi:hypothetical protein
MHVHTPQDGLLERGNELLVGQEIRRGGPDLQLLPVPPCLRRSEVRIPSAPPPERAALETSVNVSPQAAVRPPGRERPGSATRLALPRRSADIDG